MRFYIGIDIGWKGAISIIDREVKSVYIYDMPKKENFKDIADIFITIPGNDCRIGIEKQHPFPKQGVVSVFTLGWQYGYINSVLDSLNLPYIEITPIEWLKYYGLHGKKHDRNSLYKLYHTAKKLFPDAELKGKCIKDGRVDSVLIANYMRYIK